ncbi:MAG: DHHA1 domain-containing protein, partial [Spirochaetia bacterium]|nr:DHHA1 domain-containing protein [Spirochaetia bacterium]
IADMMPLRGENRMLARIGMGFEGIGKSLFPVYRSGYRSLLKTLGIKEQRISSRDVGWGIAPAVNAAGRMGETKMALDLLLESGEEKSLQLAKNLSKLNGERKKRTARNEDIIESLLNENPEKLNHPFLFCYHPDLEPGVSGIVATRLTEKFHKPVIYVNPDGPHARGSARTFANINVLDFISRAAEHFIQFGGHPEACGFSLEYDKIEDLEKSLQLNCNDIPRIQKNHNPSDFHIELSPGSLTWKAHEELELLEPFGTGNPEPRIKISSVFITDFSLMADVHAKFSIREAPSYLECIYWKKGEELKELYEKKASVNLIGCLEKSFFRGRKSLRFRLEEIVL